MLLFVKSHYYIAAAFCASALLVIGGWLWAFLSLRGTAIPLILHFNEFIGISQIGSVADLTGVALFGFTILCVNGALTRELLRKEPVWAGIVAVGTVGLSLLIFIGFAAIIGVN